MIKMVPAGLGSEAALKRRKGRRSSKIGPDTGLLLSLPHHHLPVGGGGELTVSSRLTAWERLGLEYMGGWGFPLGFSSMPASSTLSLFQRRIPSAGGSFWGEQRPAGHQHVMWGGGGRHCCPLGRKRLSSRTWGRGAERHYLAAADRGRHQRCVNEVRVLGVDIGELDCNQIMNLQGRGMGWSPVREPRNPGSLHWGPE